MKKKKAFLVVVIVVVIVLALVILLFPIRMNLKDGGSVSYKSLLYEVTKIHQLSPDVNGVKPYIDGFEIKILGMTVYRKTNEPENTKETSNIKNTINGNWKTYHEMTDGTWMCNDIAYKNRLEITGRLSGAVCDSTYVYLSNLENITFEQAWKASGLSSSMEDYFKPEDAVLVELPVEIDTQTVDVVELIDIAKRDNIPCDDSLQSFYKDDEYDYFYAGNKSEYVIAKYSDGSEKTVEEALKVGDITILDLDKYEIFYHKYKIEKETDKNTDIITIELSEADNNVITEIIANGKWTNDVTKSISNYVINIGNRTIYYNSTSGVFNEGEGSPFPVKGKSLSLTEIERQNVNDFITNNIDN